MSQNVIPALWAAGSFEAIAPFDQIVDPKVFYTVEAVRTVGEMQADKEDLFKLVYQPAGILEANYQTLVDSLIQDKGVIVSLTSKNKPVIHIPSTSIKSFPLVDGVIYERLCAIIDYGAVPPTFKDVINSATDHFANYVKDKLGIQNVRINLGTVQTRGYVPKEVAAAWEQTRQSVIKGNPSDLINLETANKKVLAQAAYIAELEAALIKAQEDLSKANAEIADLKTQLAK